MTVGISVARSWAELQRRVDGFEQMAGIVRRRVAAADAIRAGSRALAAT